MKDFETSAEPLQGWLNVTEQAVQESSTRLHDLGAKKQELHKLQVMYPSRSLILVVDLHPTPPREPGSPLTTAFNQLSISTSNSFRTV
jgi:hypothetical protein